MSLLNTLAVSSTLWQAALISQGVSSYESLLIGLDQHLSISPCDITFLLVQAEEEATWDRQYGLSTIWVNLCQARVPSMEEAVGKLTAWISSGPNWPYTLVWLHVGTHHAPLPKEGHLGILPQGGEGESLQANQPTGSLPTSCLQPASHLPDRVEWM